MKSDLETVTCELTTKTVGVLHRTWLSLSWSCGTPTSLDWVGLWDHEPMDAGGCLTWDWVESHTDGRFDTNEEFDASKTYWMAYCRRDTRWGADRILCKKRFMWHPHWMADLGEKIEGKKLRELVLPASHDAGTYGIRADSRLSPDLLGNWWARLLKDFNWVKYLSVLAFLGITKVEQVIAAWSRTQVMNVAQQLEAGYRVFDLRVAKSDFDNDFWIYHGMYSVKLTDVLQAVRAFSENNQREVIMLLLWGFREVPMSHDDHEKLLKLLKDTFGGRLARNSLGLDVTVENLWRAGENGMGTPIIVVYDYNELADPILWQKSSTMETPYSQDDFHSAEDVLRWLDKNVIPKKYDKFWDLPLILTLKAEFGELIEKTWDFGGLMGWTSKTAVQKFTDFYERQTRKINAVAVDYVNLYSLVSWAIQKNGETQQPKTRQAAQGGLVR